MRIVHLITGLDQGGAEAMLEKLLLTGRRINPEIDQSVISLGPPGIVGGRLARAGVRVESLNLRGLTLGSFRRVWRLTRMLRRQRSDTVVQTWLWHADLVGGLCARAGGNPRVIWNLRNSMPRLATTKPLSRSTAWLCARLSHWLPAKIVCNSQAALRAHTAIGYDSGKCVVIPNGFDLRVFVYSEGARQRVRASWGAAPGELLVGMVARVDSQKDHATFIRAAGKVALVMPSVSFVLIGAGVTTEATIRNLLADLSLTGRFILEEGRDDVQAVMTALDLFCLASVSEGFPNVLGEAMACATPAIATDAGDAREIIGDVQLVAPIASPESLAACMLRVLSLTADRRRALGAAQRRSVEQRFDIEQVWCTYRELYRATLSS